MEKLFHVYLPPFGLIKTALFAVNRICDIFPETTMNISVGKTFYTKVYTKIRIAVNLFFGLPTFRVTSVVSDFTDTLCLNLGRLLFKCRPRYSEFPSRFNSEIHLISFIIKVNVVNIVVLQLIRVKTEDPFRM